MIDAYKDYFKRYFDFLGKTDRAGFWRVVLANLLIGMILGVFGSLGETLSSAYSIITLIPGLAIAFRRLKDVNKSPLNLLWLLLPIVGWIILIVYLARESA